MTAGVFIESAPGQAELDRILQLADEIRAVKIGHVIPLAKHIQGFDSIAHHNGIYQPPIAVGLVAVTRYLDLGGDNPLVTAATFDFVEEDLSFRVRVKPNDRPEQYDTEFGQKLIYDIEEYLQRPEQIYAQALLSTSVRARRSVLYKINSGDAFVQRYRYDK